VTSRTTVKSFVYRMRRIADSQPDLVPDKCEKKQSPVLCACSFCSGATKAAAEIFASEMRAAMKRPNEYMSSSRLLTVKRPVEQTRVTRGRIRASWWPIARPCGVQILFNLGSSVHLTFGTCQKKQDPLIDFGDLRSWGQRLPALVALILATNREPSNFSSPAMWPCFLLPIIAHGWSTSTVSDNVQNCFFVV
jgi:hypothetical protein